MRNLKKALSLSLALVLSLTLVVPAFAAYDVTGNQMNHAGIWGGGPSLTLKGVVAEREVDEYLCYDVAVGGSLSLDMPFPAGKNRHYAIVAVGDYISSNTADNPYPAWELPKQLGGDFDESNGKTRYDYTFTENETGTLNGYDKVIYMEVYWEESDAGSDYTTDAGRVYFYIRVVPAQATTPTQPEQPAKKLAKAADQNITIDGKAVAFQTYVLHGTNYVKLRDIAHVLNGTGASFSVDYDNQKKSISLSSGKAYQDTGAEMSTPFAGANKEYNRKNLTIIVNGSPVELDALSMKDDSGNGYTYFKLRDLGSALGFNVSWTAEKGVYIESDKPYVG